MNRLAPLPRALAGAALLSLYAYLLLGARLALWHDAILFPVTLWLLARLLDDLRPRVLVLTVLFTAVFGIHLAYVWQAGFAGRNHVFAGVFALSDAGEYYWDAERVLHGVPMNTGGARRPIFSAVLAGVLRLAGEQVRVAHVVTLLAWAASGALAVAEIRRTHGLRAASVVLVLFAMFARRYVGFVQSEGVGAPLGALAFALLWRSQSVEAGWEGPWLAALGLQSLALLARPGPILVLAGIALWGLRRAPRKDRARLLAACAGAVGLAVVFQAVVRKATADVPSFGDLPPILYGLLHGEDSFFLGNTHPWINALSPAERAHASWRLLADDAAHAPWLVVLSPIRCLASWLALPQGFFGFAWLNPDDHVLEDGAAVRQAMAEHGPLGPVVLWVRTLGAYSLVNALVMAALGVAFALGLVRAAVRAFRARASDAPPFLVPVLLGLAASLPLLPPWITEGAQIFAAAFFLVAAFLATSFLPPREAPEAAPARSLAWLAPAVGSVLAALVAIAKLAPSRPPLPPCAGDGAHLADVDWGAAAVYGGPRSPRALADEADNLRLLRKPAPGFAASIARTSGEAHALVPAYDACAERMLYVVMTPEGAAARARQGRWVPLRTSPMDQAPLEEASDSP